MKRLLLIVVVVYVVIMITLALLSGVLINKDFNQQQLLAGTNVPNMIVSKVFYIPISNLSYPSDEISTESLSKSKLVTLSSNLGKLPAYLFNVTYVEQSEMSLYLENGYIGIITSTQTVKGSKILSIDGQKYTDGTADKTKYPLYYIEYLK